MRCVVVLWADKGSIMARYVRFSLFGKPSWGLASETGVQPVEHSPFDGGTPAPAGSQLDWDTITLRPPTRPTKIVAIGRNYADHAKELGHAVPDRPLLFLKPPSCLVPHGANIVFPTGQSELVHHEAELALVIGRRTRNVSEADVPAHIFGYTLMNDVTARDLQRADVQFTRAKSFDTFGPLGPWIDTDFQPAAQRISLTVNGDTRQDAHLADMIFKPAFLVSYVSQIMTLEQGDVITTGTPSGVGPLVPGDTVTVTIEGLGSLTNGVV